MSNGVDFMDKLQNLTLEINKLSENEAKILSDFIKDVYINDEEFKNKLNDLLTDATMDIIENDLSVQRSIYPNIENENLARLIVSELNYRKNVMKDITFFIDANQKAVDLVSNSVIEYLMIHPASSKLMIKRIMTQFEELGLSYSEEIITSCTRFIYNLYNSLLEGNIHPEAKKEELMLKFFGNKAEIVDQLFSSYYLNYEKLRLYKIFTAIYREE